MQEIKETIKSTLGFYVGDSKGIAPKRLKIDARVACCGGGKWKDSVTGAEVAGVHVGSSILRGPYIATNGDSFDIIGNTFALIPLELAPTIDKINPARGRVIFKGGEATLEAAENLIRITLPSTEVIEINTGRMNQ